MIHIFLKGLIIGFSIAAPVGPIGVLCIARSLHEGALTGFVTGIGAAAADGAYGIIAAFGLTFISSFLLGHQLWIRLIGGVFLCYLGIKTFLAKTTLKTNIAVEKKNLFNASLTTFFLTLTNPMTILSFVAVFAGLGLGSTHTDYSEAIAMVIGVITGSLAWWLLLSFGIGVFRTRIKITVLHWINYFSGAIIFLFGLVALLSLV